MSDWTLFSNHGHVLVCLARDADARLRDVAAAVGITERAVQKIVRDLQQGGMLSVSKQGRRNQYRIHRKVSLRHTLEADSNVGGLIDFVGGGAKSTAAARTKAVPKPAVPKPAEVAQKPAENLKSELEAEAARKSAEKRLADQEEEQRKQAARKAAKIEEAEIKAAEKRAADKLAAEKKAAEKKAAEKKAAEKAKADAKSEVEKQQGSLF